MTKQVIDVTIHDNLLVQCSPGTNVDEAIELAQKFCALFDVKCIIVHHNALFIQVTAHWRGQGPESED